MVGKVKNDELLYNGIKKRILSYGVDGEGKYEIILRNTT